MAKETAQRIGREGVYEIKEWLEATTRFAFTYSSYDSEPTCTRTCLDGSTKTFDLEGHTIDGPNDPFRPVSVESKKYTTPGHQGTEYKEFLAIAYSDTANTIKTKGGDEEREYMWVTFHPFSQRDWRKLNTLKYLRDAIEANKGLLGGAAIDEDLLAKVADHIWIMVVDRKQIGIRLTKIELAAVSMKLKQEGFRP